MANGSLRVAAHALRDRSHEHPVPELQSWERATVKFYLLNRGYGYVTLADGREVHIRRDLIEKLNISGRALKEGRSVLVAFEEDGKGLKAVGLKLLN